jgi:hypothetical protein
MGYILNARYAIHSPFTTFCTTMTVEMRECLLNELVAYAARDAIV